VRREKLIWFSPWQFFVLVRHHPIRTRRGAVIRHLASGLLQRPTAAAISGVLKDVGAVLWKAFGRDRSLTAAIADTRLICDEL
jgi:hypothetical protein